MIIKPRVGNVRPPPPDTRADTIISENEVGIWTIGKQVSNFGSKYLPVYLFLCSIECGLGLHPLLLTNDFTIDPDFGLSSVPQGQGQETWESSPYPVKVDQRFSLIIMINACSRLWATG